MGVKEIEIVIDKNGQISLQVSGIKGAGCLDLTRDLEAALGDVIKQEFTADYYESDTSITTYVKNQ